MKKALVTGIAGFAGSHLTDYLLTQKLQIFGFYHPNHPTENIDHIRDQIQIFPCDILNKKNVIDLVSKISPNYVFHLAAFSSPAESFKNPRKTLENNIIGQINLLDALIATRSKAKILVIGSADEYGKIPEKKLPADENTPLAPLSPYAVSKVTQDLLGLQYFLHYKLHIIRVRPFNHIGPRQSTNFVVSAFASQIAQLEKTGGGVIKVGNLNTTRDFTDVRDMARAYFLALASGIAGQVYNIGSGHAVKIADALNIMLSLSKVIIKVTHDRSRLRPGDIRNIYCDAAKFKKQTGWQPQIPLEQTLSDTIEYERQKLQVRSAKL